MPNAASHASNNRLCPGIAEVQRGRRQREAEIANALGHFMRKRLGRGPENVRVNLVDDMVIVRQQTGLSPAEQQLAEQPDGAELLQRFRRRLGECMHGELSDLIETLVGVPVSIVYSDTIPQGDRIDIFMLERSWEAA